MYTGLRHSTVILLYFIMMVRWSYETNGGSLVSRAPYCANQGHCACFCKMKDLIGPNKGEFVKIDIRKTTGFQQLTTSDCMVYCENAINSNARFCESAECRDTCLAWQGEPRSPCPRLTAGKRCNCYCSGTPNGTSTRTTYMTPTQRGPESCDLLCSLLEVKDETALRSCDAVRWDPESCDGAFDCPPGLLLHL